MCFQTNFHVGQPIRPATHLALLPSSLVGELTLVNYIPEFPGSKLYVQAACVTLMHMTTALFWPIKQ